MSRINRIVPNFLVIGAARSGTTTIYEILKQHGEIYLPASKRPEPHFFYKSAEYNKGYDYYLTKYFSAIGQEIAVGEVSSSYLYGKECAERIFRFNPRMKLLVMLRNPVDRAYSNYWHSVKNGLEMKEFDYAIENEELRNELLSSELRELEPYAYLGRSRYYEQIRRYLNFFSFDQMRFIILEEFLRTPDVILNEIYTFLGVNSNSLEDLIVSVSNKSTPVDQSMSPEIRINLNKYFREHNDKLSELLNKDLSFWNH